MKLLLAFGAIILAYPLSANAGFFDRAFRDIGRIQAEQQLQLKNAIDQIEEQKRRQALEKAEKDKQAPPPPPRIDSAALSKMLVSKSSDELLTLSIEPNICSTINCHGIDAAVVRNLINTVRTDKQLIIDTEIKQIQAWAAIGSAVIATVSLLISIASFIRSGRTTKADRVPATQRGEFTLPVAATTGSDRA
ncbi:hypothetical protein [Methylorubrum sp. POS3]|uniref:hypothetical protein n=1 Tax=Methylorubrum sp. POS3 TaxID=2998492 RepID=UPI00372948F6